MEVIQSQISDNISSSDRNSEVQEFRSPDNSEIQTFTNPEFRNSGIQKSRNLEIQKSKKLEIQKFGIADIDL